VQFIAISEEKLYRKNSSHKSSLWYEIALGSLLSLFYSQKKTTTSNNSTWTTWS